jgi:hypothetical protein
VNDRGLLAGLAGAFERHDPVPSEVVAAAEGAGRLVGPARSWTALALVDGPTGLRGGGAIGFADRWGRVDVDVEPGRLTGLRRGPGAVWVRWPAGERAVVVDDVGRFAVTGLPAGPLCVVLRRPGAPDAVGPWFVG